MKIWVDADACPKAAKEIIYKISYRLKIKTFLVANTNLIYPINGFITGIKVEKGSDKADEYIVENLTQNDLVITADIPLAAKVVEKGAIGINPRGEIYTEENVQERLSIRDFMQELRDNGTITGGPTQFGVKDKERFANALDRTLTKMLKNNIL